MKLSKNQMLDFTLIAKKGNAKTHAKWSPVATCIMRGLPQIDFAQDKIKTLEPDQKQELVEKCPRRVFSYNQLRQEVEIENADKCNLCNECIKYTQDLGLERAIKITETDTRFEFTVESTGALPPDQVVLKAFTVLKQKLTMLKDQI